MGFFDKFKKKKPDIQKEETTPKNIKTEEKRRTPQTITPVYIGFTKKVADKTKEEILNGSDLTVENNKNDDLIEYLHGSKDCIFIGGNRLYKDAKKGNSHVAIIVPRGLNIIDIKGTLIKKKDDPRIKKWEILENLKYDIAFVGAILSVDVLGVLDINKNSVEWNKEFDGDKSRYELMIKIGITKPKNDKLLNVLENLAFIDPHH